MNTFEVEVAERPEVTVVGLGVLTSVQNAPEECPKLWQRFMPHALKMLGKSEKDLEAGYSFESYGVCKAVSGSEGECIFEYIASIPAPAGSTNRVEGADGVGGETPAPELTTLTLAKGLYAKFKVPNLSVVKDAYNFLYNIWPAEQDKYTVDFNAPCFEFFPVTWIKDGIFYICAPVTVKA